MQLIDKAQDIAVEQDVLATLLGEDTAGELGDLELDAVQMPVAKSSVFYSISIHC